MCAAQPQPSTVASSFLTTRVLKQVAEFDIVGEAFHFESFPGSAQHALNFGARHPVVALALGRNLFICGDTRLRGVLGINGGIQEIGL